MKASSLFSGAGLSVLAALVWPLQAAVIARVFSGLLLEVPVQPLPMAALFLGLSALRTVLNAAALRAQSAAADARLSALRAEIIAREAATVSPSAMGGAGAVASLATEKVEALRPFLLRYQPARLRVMVIPLVILALSAWFSWAVALVLLMAGPLIPVFMALVGWAAKEASARQMVEVGDLSDLLVDRLAALSDLRLIGAGPAVVAGFAQASGGLRERTMAVLRIAFLSSTVLELFAAIGVAMVAVWVGFSLLGEVTWGTRGAPLTPFAGVFMLLLAPDFFQPLRDLAAAWHDKSAADAVEDELSRWRADDRPALMGTGAAGVRRTFAGLRTRGLALRRGDRLIRYPDLDLSPGESLALTGISGVGKTTLLGLLAGLERPTAGEITLDGLPLDEDSADDWRAGLGWMPQTPHFLGRSLRHNIAFGSALDPRVLDTARIAPVIAALPRGDLTPLGERGAGLSGGEARRVMLARALHGAPALLIADEPTADLDGETADDITRGLLDFVARGGTLIAATHDPRLVDRLHRELRLEPGA